MPRRHPAFAAICLAVLLITALPAAGQAQRHVDHRSAFVHAESIGDSLVGSFLAWGQGALGWIRALVAAEHGTVVPTSPPPPAPEPLAVPTSPSLTPAP